MTGRTSDVEVEVVAEEVVAEVEVEEWFSALAEFVVAMVACAKECCSKDVDQMNRRYSLSLFVNGWF